MVANTAQAQAWNGEQGQHFVAENQLAIRGSEFELRVGDEDALGPRVLRRPCVDFQCQLAQARGEIRADPLRHLVENENAAPEVLAVSGGSIDDVGVRPASPERP